MKVYDITMNVSSIKGKERMQNSTLIKCFSFFSKTDKVKFFSILIAQVIFSILDLLGVIVFGVLTSLIVAGPNRGGRVDFMLTLVGLNKFDYRIQIAVLGLSIVIFFCIKSISSIYFYSRLLRFMSIRMTQLTSNLINRFFSLSIQEISENNSQKNIYVIMNTPNNISALISSYFSLFTDLFLCLIILGGLIYIDLGLTLVVVLFFGTFAFVGYSYHRNKLFDLSKVRAETNARANQLVNELILSFREIFVSGRISNLTFQVSKKLMRSAHNEAKLSMVPVLNKYLFEISTYVFIFVISVFKILTSSKTNSVATISIFLVAITRIVPAIVRIQQSLITLKSVTGLSIENFEYLNRVKDVKIGSNSQVEYDRNHLNFIPNIKIEKLDFCYQNNLNFKMSIHSLNVHSGERVAFVGKSGSGKSTLADLIIGVLKPCHGSILINNHIPQESILKWPGAISYVPQTIHLIDGTIRENLGLGLNLENISDAHLWETLDKARIKDFIMEKSLGLDSKIGENGYMLSGGQKQRLSIARALLTNPKLIVLDEATSALDSETENEITKLLDNLSSETTVIIIAHRLSTIKNIPKLFYFDAGRITAEGNFESLKRQNLSFNRQAEFSGL